MKKLKGKLKAWWDLTTKEDWVIGLLSSIAIFWLSYYFVHNSLLFSFAFPFGFMLKVMLWNPLSRYRKAKKDGEK